MRVFKFRELAVGDKFVSSSKLGNPEAKLFFPEDALDLMEKVGCNSARMCRNETFIMRFEYDRPCVKVLA